MVFKFSNNYQIKILNNVNPGVQSLFTGHTRASHNLDAAPRNIVNLLAWRMSRRDTLDDLDQGADRAPRADTADVFLSAIGGGGGERRREDIERKQNCW